MHLSEPSSVLLTGPSIYLCYPLLNQLNSTSKQYEYNREGILKRHQQLLAFSTLQRCLDVYSRDKTSGERWNVSLRNDWHPVVHILAALGVEEEVSLLTCRGLLVSMALNIIRWTWTLSIFISQHYSFYNPVEFRLVWVRFPEENPVCFYVTLHGLKLMI